MLSKVLYSKKRYFKEVNLQKNKIFTNNIIKNIYLFKFSEFFKIFLGLQDML